MTEAVCYVIMRLFTSCLLYWFIDAKMQHFNNSLYIGQQLQFAAFVKANVWKEDYHHYFQKHMFARNVPISILRGKVSLICSNPAAAASKPGVNVLIPRG